MDPVFRRYSEHLGKCLPTTYDGPRGPSGGISFKKAQNGKLNEETIVEDPNTTRKYFCQKINYGPAPPVGKAHDLVLVIQASSAGHDAGNYAKITLNGFQVPVQKHSENTEYRGLHIVVVNPKTGKIEVSRVFDTHKSSSEFEEFISTRVPTDHIVIAACKGECVKGLSDKAKEWFYNMGSQEIFRLCYRQGFVFIGKSGRLEPHEKRAIMYNF